MSVPSYFQPRMRMIGTHTVNHLKQMNDSVGSNHSHPGLERTWDTHVIMTISALLCENTKRLLLNAVVFLDQSLRR